MNFIDEEEAAATYGEGAVPVSTAEPSVIQYEAAHGKVFWSEYERQFVAPSGDVKFFHSAAAIVSVLKDLHERYPSEAAKITEQPATVVDAVRGGVRAAAPAAVPVSRGAMPRTSPFGEDDPDEDETTTSGGKGWKTNAEVAYEDEDGEGINTYSMTFSGDTPVTIAGPDITAKLGPAVNGDDWCAGVCWPIALDNGDLAAIHDWKQSSTYDDALPDPDDLAATNTSWFISGEAGAVAKLKAILGLS